MDKNIQLLTTEKQEIDSLWKNILKNERDAKVITEALGFSNANELLDKIEAVPLYLVKESRNAVINVVINVASKDEPEVPEFVVKHIENLFKESEPRKIKLALYSISEVPVHKAPSEHKHKSVIYKNMCIIHNALCELQKYCDSENSLPLIFNCEKTTGKSLYEHIANHDLDTIISLISYICAYKKTSKQYEEIDIDIFHNAERAYEILTDMLVNNKPYVLERDDDSQLILPSDKELAEALK